LGIGNERIEEVVVRFGVVFLILIATTVTAAAGQAADALKTATGKTPEEYEAAEAGKESRKCFDVLMAPRGGGTTLSTDAASSILLNRCTGDTWLLVKTSVGKPGKSDDYVYRWYPISTGSSEVVLSRPGPLQ
jgi:hypothetical protein